MQVDFENYFYAPIDNIEIEEGSNSDSIFSFILSKAKNVINEKDLFEYEKEKLVLKKIVSARKIRSESIVIDSNEFNIEIAHFHGFERKFLIFSIEHEIIVAGNTIKEAKRKFKGLFGHVENIT